MLSKCLILWIGYFAASSIAGTVPSWLKPCPALDSKCMINSLDASMQHLAEGNAELGTPPIEPLPIKDTESSVGSLKVNFINVLLHNLSQCKFKTFTRDLDKSLVNITTVCPVGIKGEYKMKGNIIGVNLFGNDKFSIEGGNILAKIGLYLKTVIKSGKKYYKLAKFNYEFDPISKFNLNFNNLNNGDKETASAMTKFMDASWKELMVDFGSPIMTECMLTLTDVVNKVFQVLSANEIETA